LCEQGFLGIFFGDQLGFDKHCTETVSNQWWNSIQVWIKIKRALYFGDSLGDLCPLSGRGWAEDKIIHKAVLKKAYPMYWGLSIKGKV